MESHSPWASPIVLVKKKNGDMRFCCDYRAVNTVVKHDAYPLPRIEDLLEATSGSRYFSILDQTSAYWAIPLGPDSQEKTAFITEYGLFQWTRQPFGLKTSPASFQRVMEDVLGELLREQVVVYLDDGILFTDDLSQHLRCLRETLEKYRRHGLKLNPGKCVIGKTEVDFLGHRVSQEGIRPSVSKLEALEQWPTPETSKDLRTILGFAG